MGRNCPRRKKGDYRGPLPKRVRGKKKKINIKKWGERRKKTDSWSEKKGKKLKKRGVACEIGLGSKEYHRG